MPTAPDAAAYPVDALNRVKRCNDRAAYDHATVHALLDGGMLCHVAWVLDGQPLCTPTFYWRDGHTLYWHGSSASRMLRQLAQGQPACLTVTQLDSLVLARSAYNHSADYRSVMCFGQARLLEDPQAKAQALVAMVERLFPGRDATLRPPTAQEIKATAVIAMDIERASAKLRDAGVVDDEADHALPIWAERLPVHTVLGEPEPCSRLAEGLLRPADLAGWRPGRALEEALREAQEGTVGP
ncbi:MAG: hypothetical protein RLY78_208 [Pseudomonadota bacterium]|jgi:nitroimidazol reductase NimA-like FMN-containing flavoprotein (pyridoxamine 5'-phosphate oxidase superfamily)